MIPIKPSALNDDEIPIPYHHSEKALYKILNQLECITNEPDPTNQVEQ